MTTVIVDTSVLVNFLAVDEIPILVSVPDTTITITEHVRAEVTEHYPDQLHRLRAALTERQIHEIVVDDLRELELFARYTESGLGIGECSAMAAAVHRELRSPPTIRKRKSLSAALSRPSRSKPPNR